MKLVEVGLPVRQAPSMGAIQDAGGVSRLILVRQCISSVIVGSRMVIRYIPDLTDACATRTGNALGFADLIGCSTIGPSFAMDVMGQGGFSRQRAAGKHYIPRYGCVLSRRNLLDR